MSSFVKQTHLRRVSSSSHTHNEQTIIEEALKNINVNAHHVNGHPHVHKQEDRHTRRRRFQNHGTRDHYPIQPHSDVHHHPSVHHKKSNVDEDKKENKQQKKEVDNDHKHWKHSHPLIHKKSNGGCCRIKSSDAICPPGKVTNNGSDTLCCKHNGNTRQIDSYPFCY